MSEPFLDILQNYISPNKYRIMIIPKYKQNEQRVKNHVSIRNESRREDNLCRLLLGIVDAHCVRLTE
jgi:hypothetical protein